jgi:hypothetical protein
MTLQKIVLQNPENDANNGQYHEGTHKNPSEPPRSCITARGNIIRNFIDHHVMPESVLNR